MKKNILVTGGAGFTGSNLARKLLSKGYDVSVLARKSSDLSRLNGLRLKIINGDIRDKASADVAVKNADIVYHIAASYQDYKLKDKDYWDINVKGTKNLLDAAVKYKIRRFIHCSTVGVLGDIREIPANEGTAYNPGDIYQKTKAEAEKLALLYHKKYRLPVVVVRPAGIYGPGDKRFLRLIKSIYKKRFFMIGKGDKLYHLTYIDDLINGFILAGAKKNATGQIYIIAGEKPVMMKDFVLTISKILKVPVNNLRLPLLPILILSWACDKLLRPLGMNPPLVPRRLDPFWKNRAFDISKAKKELGYNPKTSLEEGLKKTIQWYKENHWL
ncbi:NAD-dependent epimerase/dehydratase family protein [Candidatus Woesearchaeota archaeon]|nr:NAD-dependent epimerase/dehydratase family protein [Candidatus Woesearchaeota archaeon]